MLHHLSAPHLRFNTQGLSLSSRQTFSRPGGCPSCLLAKGDTASAPHKLCLTAETKARNPILAWKLQRHQAQINTQASRTLLPEGKGAQTVQCTSPTSTGDPVSPSPCTGAHQPHSTPSQQLPSHKAICHTGSTQSRSVLGNAFAAAATPKVGSPGQRG